MYTVHNGVTSSLLVLGFGLEAAAAATPAMEAGQGLSAEMEEIVAGGSVLMVLSNYVFAAVFFVVFGL